MSHSPYERAIGKDSFRVLLLEPGKDNQQICCNLLACNSFDNVTYEAISYAWGDETSKATIRCNSANLHLTQDLELCLKALRSDSETRSLWIDQICINQDDLDEKSAQVSIMGAIYRSAARVVVWLGPASPYSDQTLAFITELCEAFLAYYQAHGDELIPFRDVNEVVRIEPTGFELPAQSDRRWMALSELLRRPWFSRYWIIQEVMVNDKVIVQCGDGQLDWFMLRRLSQVLQNYSALVMRLCSDGSISAGSGLLAALNIAEVMLRKSNHQTASTESSEIQHYRFSHYVHIFSRQSVKHGCDRIYSLLGIGNWPDVQDIKIDYRLSTSQIYMDFTVRAMKHDCNLDHLTFVEYPGETSLEGLPSWVPDWTNSPKSKPNGIKVKTCYFFRASGKQPVHEPFRVCGKELLVRARLIDFISNPRMEYPFQFGFDLALRAQGFDQSVLCKEEEAAFFGLVENTINACQPYSTRETTMAIMCRLLFWDSLSRPTYHGPSIEDYQKAFREYRDFARWMREIFEEFQESDDDETAIEAWLLLHPRPATDHCHAASFINELCVHLIGMAIVKTREGFMANVPAQAKTGDTIAVIHGCKTPLVLRRREPDGYILIGECYVQGIMYGEAMEMGFDEKEIALV